MRVEGARCDHPLNAVSVVIVATGKTFKALARTEVQFDPGMELGPDPRERMVLSAVRDDVKPLGLLEKNAPSQVPVTINGIAHKITKRDDNTASPFIEFDLVRT